jgi:hypothetical protein
VIRWARQSRGAGRKVTLGLPCPRAGAISLRRKVWLLDDSYGRAFPPSHRTLDFGRGSGFDEGVAGEG